MSIMQKLKSRVIDLWSFVSKIGDNILNSNTFFRWTLLLTFMIVLVKSFGFEFEEIRVTFLLLWYAFISVMVSSFMNYIYSTVNYHKPTEQMEKIGSLVIFASTMIFCALVIFGTYIVQYD